MHDLVAEIIFGVVASATGLGVVAWVALLIRRPRARPAPVAVAVPRQRPVPRCRYCKSAMRSYEKMCRTCGGSVDA